MVYSDINQSSPVTNKSEKTPALIIDRVFSFLIDYLVLSPFVMFILYFTFNNGFLFAKTNPTAPENSVFYILMALCYFTLFALFQTVFIGYWKATPGQYFLKIKFELDEDDSLSLLRMFFRQILFWLSFAMLGLPFLSVMTNKRRRTFYDQVADVSVVSEKKETQLFSFELEFRYWRALMGTLTFFFTFLFSAFIWINYDKIVSRSGSFAAYKEIGFFCEEIKEVELATRLETAVALNLVNQLSDECLDHEADFVLWKQKAKDYSLAYYAKSLTTEDASKEKKYLAQACDGQEALSFENLSLACKVAHSFAAQEYEKLYNSLQSLNGVFIDVLKYELANALGKQQAASENFNALAQYNDIKPMKKYQILEILTRSEMADQISEKKLDRVPASLENYVEPIAAPEQETYVKVKASAKDHQAQSNYKSESSELKKKLIKLLEDL